MKRKDVSERFAAVVKAAEKYNNTRGNDKRFYPMTDGRRGHMISVGLYDYQTKQYALCDVLSYQIEDCVKQMEDMVGIR
jgi:hypothetical protein